MAKHPSHGALLTNGCTIFQAVWASTVCSDEWDHLNSSKRERAIDEARPAVKPVCAAMLSFANVKQMQSSGSRVLEGFARAGLSKAVAAAGGVRALVSILKAGPKDDNDPSRPADKVFGCATVALGELTNSRDFVKVFIAEGGVQAALRYIKQDQLPVCGAALCRTVAHCAKRLEDAQRESLLPQLKSALIPMRQFVELNHICEARPRQQLCDLRCRRVADTGQEGFPPTSGCGSDLRAVWRSDEQRSGLRWLLRSTCARRHDLVRLRLSLP